MNDINSIRIAARAGAFGLAIGSVSTPMADEIKVGVLLGFT